MPRRDDGHLDVLLSLFGPVRRRYCPCQPTARQEAFLLLQDKEVFLGGGAGGGKTVAMLMAALQYADVPGYDALMLRPSLTELQLPGGLIDLSHDWLTDTKARWSGDAKTWRFPGKTRSGSGGASVGFGYLSTTDDVSRYAGTSYSFLGFDELTRFEESHFARMFRALRQPADTSDLGAAPDGTTLAQVPPRIRATSNPGGHGHGWVKDRYVNPATRRPDVVFLPSTLVDNPHLDQTSYMQTLAELPTAERERLLNGNWEIPDDGELFKREWFQQIEAHQLPTDGTTSIRYWDLAATEPSAGNRDPDYTVGLLLYYHQQSGTYYIADIIRDRKAPGAVENLVRETAERDGTTVKIVIEKEPGAAGVHAADRYTRHVLRGYFAYARPASGDKHTRARPVAAAAENGYVKLVRGLHTAAFLDELSSFPHGKHDDCVDALSGAHAHTDRYGPASIHVPTGHITLPDFSGSRTPRRPHYRGSQLEATAALLGATIWNAPPHRIRRRKRGD